MTGLEALILTALLATLAAVAVFVVRTMGSIRHLRLMRCPETGAITFVGAERVPGADGMAPKVTVRSCDLWPQKEQCARGCLERFEQVTPGYRINVESLRPFDRP